MGRVRAAAAADQRHAIVAHEALVEIGQALGREVVGGDAVFTLRGRPAFGSTDTRRDEFSPRKRTCSCIRSGPVAQLKPMTSTSSASSAGRAAAISVPMSMVPVVSIVTCVMIGTSRPAKLHRATAGQHGALHTQDVLRRLDLDDVDATSQQAMGSA